MSTVTFRWLLMRRAWGAGLIAALALVCANAFAQATSPPPTIACQVQTPGPLPEGPAIVPGALQLIWADAPQTSPALPPRTGVQVLHPEAPPGAPPQLATGQGLIVLTPELPPGMPSLPPGTLKVITPPIAGTRC